MRSSRFLLPAILATVLLVMAGPALALAPPAIQPAVVHGTVARAELPYAIVLEDGTRVELDVEHGLILPGNPAAPRPGDRVTVIGHSTAGMRDIQSAEIFVRRPAGQPVPLPPDPCTTTASTAVSRLFERLPGANPAPSAGPRPAGAASTRWGSTTMLSGVILSVADQSFRLQPMTGPAVDVLVDGETEYINVSGLDGLSPGDGVRVEGSYAGAAFKASSVELVEGGGGGDGGGTTELTGMILSIGSQSFRLQPEHETAVDVLVDQNTQYVNAGSLEDLAVGDMVRVTGRFAGDGFQATTVELMEQGGGDGGGGGSGSTHGVHNETTGLVTALAPPDAFRLDNGRTYHVTADTVYGDGLTGYADLAAGQFLEVEGNYHGGVYTALNIELEGEQSGGQEYREIDGTVTAVGMNSLTVDQNLDVRIMPFTRFNGDADSLDEIQSGWTVEVDALVNMMGQLLAREIRTHDPAPATTENQDFEPKQALVVLVDGADPQQIAERYGASVAGIVGHLGYLFRWQDVELTDDLLARIDADSQVLAVEPNYLFRDPESSRKRFPVVDRSPAIEKYLDQPATTEIQLPSALQHADGSGTVVAIMDTGVEPCQPLIQDRLVPGGLDVIDGDLEPWETRDGIDEDGDGLIDEAAGHGTFVASIIALVAPGARILPYRVLDDDGGGTAYGLALALADAIDRGVDVINLSLTYHTRSTVVDLLLERAAAKGIVIVAAAGNEPVSTLPFPAVDSHVLAVTALDATGTALADFANTSTQPPLVAAPGEDVYGALDRGRYGYSTGTSAAAPFAAGTAALIKSIDKGIEPSLAQDAIVQGGSPLVSGTWSGVVLDAISALDLVGP